MPTTLPRARPNARFRANIRGFYALLGSLILLGAAPIGASRLIHVHTAAARIAGVIVGIAGMLPWMWIVFAMIRRGDEFEQRIHLAALGVAFAAALVLILALEMLRRAQFIGVPDLMGIWIALLVIWVVAMLGAKRYFERPA